MHSIILICLLIAGVIHLLPLAGLLGADRLSALYGVSLSDPNTTILLRHRAVLFGLLGALLCYAAFDPALRTLALAAGLISAGAFAAIALGAGEYNAQIGRVLKADYIALAALALAAALHAFVVRQP